MKYHASKRRLKIGRDVAITPAVLETWNKYLKEAWTPMKEDQPILRTVPEDGKLKPIFAIESRPSSINGLQFWAVLSYKEHKFSLPLPMDFIGMDEVGQNLALAPVAEKLRAQLAPILIAEDMADGTQAAEG